MFVLLKAAVPIGLLYLTLLCVVLCLTCISGQAQKSVDSTSRLSDSLHYYLVNYKLHALTDSSLTFDKVKTGIYEKGKNDLLFIKKYLKPFTFSKKDSIKLKEHTTFFHLPDSGSWKALFKKTSSQEEKQPTRQGLKFTGGYLSYNWNYRSALDSPFAEGGLSQHLIAASVDVTVAEKLPLRISYFGRESNSPYFKSYRDFRVDVDVQRYRELRTQSALAYVKSYAQNLRNPFMEYALKATSLRSAQYQDLLHDPSVIKELIQSKETLLRKDFADTSQAFKDSLHAGANRFIQFYDSLHYLQKKYEHLHDSLYQVYQKAEAQIKTLEQLAGKKTLTVEEAAQLAATYGKKDRRVQRLLKAFEGIRTLSLGRTFPNYSSLTLQNVNVNGVNVEYNRRALYLAAAAGTVDFRIRDFLWDRQTRVPQYLYLARVGYGSRTSHNVIVTYFAGKKQLLGSSQQSPSAYVQGLSLSAQYFVNKHTRLYGEMAQSGAPYVSATGYSEKSALRFNDPTQKAYAMGLTSYLPIIQTKIEGHYQHSGLNYQCFNSFQFNANANSWSAKLEQPFWKRQLILQAGVRKNDFTNPFVLQRFNTNTVFKSLTLTLRKASWPVVSIGYLPLAQNTVIGNQIYENHFQTFSGNLFHQYNLGLAKTATTLMYHRYYNDGSDSGLVYFNSSTVFWNQSFVFTRYTASVGASLMRNSDYVLSVLEAGVSSALVKSVNVDLTLKVNQLKGGAAKFGFRGGTRCTVKKLGELNVWTEKSYLPSQRGGLYKYEMYNLGFTRFFK